MYSIVNVIYGIPITDEIEKRNQELLDADPNEEDESLGEELECYGFETFYSGSHSGIVGYLGVELSDFDECHSYLKFKDLKFEPTPAQKAEAEKKIANLDNRFKDVLPEIGVYLIFSTS